MFSKRHYVAVVNALRKEANLTPGLGLHIDPVIRNARVQGFRYAIAALGALFEKDNPNFDILRFQDALYKGEVGEILNWNKKVLHGE